MRLGSLLQTASVFAVRLPCRPVREMAGLDLTRALVAAAGDRRPTLTVFSSQCSLVGARALRLVARSRPKRFKVPLKTCGSGRSRTCNDSVDCTVLCQLSYGPDEEVEAERIELPTRGLQGHRSTAELRPR